MRKPAALAALFPTLRGDVLAATLTQPTKWWYLSELAHFLQTTPSSLQRELRALVDGGILETRRDGARAYLRADTCSPLFPELRGLIEKTTGLLPTLRDVLDRFEPHISCAFVYGSVAQRPEYSSGDVDLLVIGELAPGNLVPALREAESKVGRDVKVISYSARDFRRKVASRDQFLSDILRGPKHFIKGDQDVLAAITRERQPRKDSVVST